MSFIKVACLGAPFGLKGAFHFYPFSQQIDHFLELSVLFYKKDDHYIPLKIKNIATHGDHLTVFFEDINDRTIAQQWVGTEIFIKDEHLPVLPEGQYYWHQLQGMAIATLSGQSLGHVSSIYTNGHQDILISNQEEHIPFLMGTTIHKVDLIAHKIIVCFDATMYDQTPEN